MSSSASTPTRPCRPFARHRRARDLSCEFPAPWRARRFRRVLITSRPGTPKANPKMANTWTWFSVGDSSYNSLQVDVNHRFSHDLSSARRLHLVEGLDDGDSLNATTAGNAPGLVSNPYDVKADWGPATYDVRNLGVISAVYGLPFGNGKQFAGGLGKLAQRSCEWLVGEQHCRPAGRIPVHAATQLQPIEQRGHTQSGAAVYQSELHGSAILGKPSQWFNPSAFLRRRPTAVSTATWEEIPYRPGAGHLGFLGGQRHCVHERLNLQFRAEIFNLLDRANFNTPNLIVFTPSGVSGTAGAITSTSTTARQVQFGVKLLW